MGEAYNWVVSICLKTFFPTLDSAFWALNCNCSVMMASVMFFVAALVAISFSSVECALRPRRCPGGLTFISNLEVSSNGVACTRFPCKLIKGADTDISLQVTTTKNVATGTPNVMGTVGRIPLPWAVPAAAGYPQVTKVGDVSTYKMRFPVSSLYPSIRSTVTWKLNAPDGSNIFCFRMAVALSA